MIIYTNGGCQHCVNLKAELKEKGIDFKEFSVSDNFDDALAVSNKVGGDTRLPLVDCEDGRYFSQPSIEDLLPV